MVVSHVSLNRQNDKVSFALSHFVRKILVQSEIASSEWNFLTTKTEIWKAFVYCFIVNNPTEKLFTVKVFARSSNDNLHYTATATLFLYFSRQLLNTIEIKLLLVSNFHNRFVPLGRCSVCGARCADNI